VLRYKLPIGSIILPALLIGCTGTLTTVNDYVLDKEDTVRAVDDRRLDLGHKLTCSAGLEAIRRKYGDDPETLEDLLGLCGWSDSNKAVIIDVIRK
jgi:hypothetical protein